MAVSKHDPFRWDMAFLSAMNPEEHRSVFTRPHAAVWGTLAGMEARCTESVHDRLSAAVRPDFLRCCLASRLLRDRREGTDDDPLLLWIREKLPDPASLGLPFSWEELTAWRWVRVPLALADPSLAGKGAVCHALLGIGPERGGMGLWPSWGDLVLTSDARQAVADAVSCAQSGEPAVGFFFWPQVAMPHPPGVISGPSIGLPVYLGFSSLRRNLPLPSILATGALVVDHDTGESRLHAITYAPQKYGLAKKAAFRAFIYPRGSHPEPSAEPVCELLVATCLRHAEILWHAYVPGHGQPLAEFLSYLDHPQTLIRNLAQLPESLLPLPVIVRERIRALLLQAPTIPRDVARGALGTLTNDLEDILNSESWNHDRITAILDTLDEQIVAMIGESISLKQAFRLSCLQVKRANHCGQIAACREWGERAFVLFEQMRQARETEGDGNRFLLLLYMIIGRLHNSFELNGLIPAEYAVEVARIRKKLEADYKRSKHQGHVSPVLGKFYGTMLQHHAFCGTRKDLTAAVRYSAKALEAFGEVAGRPLNKDCLRQYSYLVYLHLERNDLAQATRALCLYLKTETVDSLNLENLADDPHKPAVLARYLAQTGQKLPRYQEWAREQTQRIAFRHPWQLWLYNLGIIEDASDLKTSYWLSSLEVCRRKGSYLTLTIMALLPLAALHKHRLADEAVLRAGVEQAMRAVRHADIFQPHFARLLRHGDDWQTILDVVEADKAELFPFTYR